MGGQLVDVSGYCNGATELRITIFRAVSFYSHHSEAKGQCVPHPFKIAKKCEVSFKQYSQSHTGVELIVFSSFPIYRNS